ncbi:MAG: penicillin-binding protein [Clostridiales bacterium]|nr:penicillin-binding protein [Clostridiales bacterium]
MLGDLLDIARELLRRILASRLFALGMAFCVMFAVLIVRLFRLQIVEGETYLNEYVQMTEQTVSTPGTRGNIYDRNGYLLAYNEPAYSVTIRDTGDYPDNTSMNEMLLRLVQILNKHGFTAQGKLEITVDEDGQFAYTSSSEAARNRFLRDYYGLRSVDQLDDDRGRYPSNVRAADLIALRRERYNLNAIKDERGNPVILTPSEELQLIDIRYTMSLSSYKRYEDITITSYVDDETVADILEHAAELRGVSVAESTIRVYNDSIYFAPIIGYTGKMPEDQLEELQKENPEYDINDIVGRIGIEASMETELQGGKGYRSLVVNNVGSIMEVISETEPITGNDIYLTIDRDLQVGIYHLIEQQLAGIIASKLVNEDVDTSDYSDMSKMPIPVKDVYYQLINNNVLSLSHMAQEEASEMEQEIDRIFSSARTQALSQIRSELLSEHPTAMKDLPRDMKAYMLYIYNYLYQPEIGIVRRDLIDTADDRYQRWQNEEISLREYLYAGISESWVDTAQLRVESKYSSADDIYESLVNYIIDDLQTDNRFAKRLFRYLIDDGSISGRQLCVALFDQGILPYDEEQVRLLRTGGELYAYTFMKEKISNVEITPAQLALDPCTGSVVITDVNTGEVRALVTYPSYDNNRLSGTVDAAYYSQLREDLSLPLYNNATQAQKAPGSTFKPITAIAALEEHVIDEYETVNCSGIYEAVAMPIRCWIYPGNHGPLNVREALQNSCNYFFNEMAHRLSMDEDGNYSTERGIEVIRKYAAMFGLDRLSGVEISETQPQMTTEDPERSAMGQGTNSYSNVQLSRYVAALANRGTVFQLSLLDKMTDSDGNLLKDFTPEVSSHIDIASTTWDAVQEGMRAVVAEGSSKRIFADLEVPIAGKTGTAQESNSRPNHAFFISFGPYPDPEICVTVNIPYGYASSNAATLAKSVYRFYYGYTDLDYILNTGALDVSNVKIGD